MDSRLNHNLLAQIVLSLLSVFLLIDSVNGFFLMSMGVDVKISVLYKSCVLSILILYLVKYKLRVVLSIVAVICLLMVGESSTIFLVETSGNYLGFVVQHIAKLVTPVLLFFFLLDRSIRDKQLFAKIEKVMMMNCCIFLANILVGLLGFGFSTYGSTPGDGGIGIKGFFFAGNEISTLLILFTGFYLSRAYLTSKKLFVGLAFFWISVGFLISTKTAMLSTLVLVTMVPVVLEGKRLFLLNNMTSLIFISALTIILSQAFFLYEAFTGTLIFDRLAYFYQKTGLWGLIFSGRTEFLASMWGYYDKDLSVFSLVFGKGVSYFAAVTKYSVELDFVDMFFWHGLVGVGVIVYIFMLLTSYSVKNFFDSDYPLASVILMLNLLLAVISNFSGHVFTSGMLGLLWPCVAIMAKHAPDSRVMLRAYS